MGFYLNKKEQTVLRLVKMKKKRKKSILVYSLNPLETFLLSNPNFQPLPSLISAPDVPHSLNNSGGDLQPCRKFYEDLFDNFINENEITLRVFIRQLAENMIVSWNTNTCRHKLTDGFTSKYL